MTKQLTRTSEKDLLEAALKQFGTRIKDARIKLGLSHTELCYYERDILNPFSGQFLSSLEKGRYKHRPRLGTTNSILAAFKKYNIPKEDFEQLYEAARQLYISDNVALNHILRYDCSSFDSTAIRGTLDCIS